MASRVAVMNRGRLVQIGAPAEIYERPCSRFVAGFVGEVNLFEGRLAEGCLAVIDFDQPFPFPRRTDLAEGSEAAVAIRPEKLVLSPAPPAGFAIAARVTSITYLGGGSMVHLAAGQGVALKAYLPSALAGKLERGMAIWASWQPQDGVVLRQ